MNSSVLHSFVLAGRIELFSSRILCTLLLCMWVRRVRTTKLTSKLTDYVYSYTVGNSKIVPRQFEQSAVSATTCNNSFNNCATANRHGKRQLYTRGYGGENLREDRDVPRCNSMMTHLSVMQ